MQVFESFQNATGDKLGGVIVEAASVSQYGPNFSSQTSLHEHVNVLGIAKGAIQSMNKKKKIRVGHSKCTLV